MVNLNQLSHLLALAEECHFARAAERVHLSQPAFSRSIQAIERQVEMRLFERQSGAVRPTPAGLFLIDKARKLLFDARCVSRDITLYRENQLGDAAFGVGPFPAVILLQQVLTAVRSRYPQICLRVDVNNWQHLLKRLMDEEIDFFVADARDIAASAELEVQALTRQRGGFYVRADHPLGQQPHALTDVWRYGVAATRLPSGVKTALGMLLGLPVGQVPALALECDDVSTLHGIACTTDTVAATVGCSVQAQVNAGLLRELEIVNAPALFVDISIVSLRNRTPSPMARELIQTFGQVAAAL